MLFQIPVYQHLIMPPPKDMPVIREPQIISEIQASVKKRGPTATSHKKSSFISLSSKNTSKFSLISKESFTNGA